LVNLKINIMKKIFIFSVFFSLLSFGFSQEETKDITPFFSYSTFYSQEQGPYVETYLTILGHSLYFGLPENDKYFAQVELTILFKQGEKIIDFKKLLLKSPENDDTTKVDFLLVDVQRFALPNGIYDIEIKLVDTKSPFDPLYITDQVTLDYDAAKTAVSSIQLIERFTKSEEKNIFTKAGYELIPLPLNFYPKSVSSLTFYCEIYNTNLNPGPEKPFLIKSYIEQLETHKITAGMQIFKREQTRDVLSFMHQFDISVLPSGNYLLVVELRDINNELLAVNKLFFQRSNPVADADYLAMNLAYENSFVTKITSRDSLAEFVRCTRPKATDNEKSFIDNQTKTADLSKLQQFFFAFWANRSEDPETEWRNYYFEVQKAQQAYSTKIKKGYQTDRGRVYLQFGAPNTITARDNEPSTYPYEIWHYYQLDNQRNRKFIFYNRDLVTNDYELLHSDAFGEIQDHQWQLKLNQRNFATSDPDMQKNDWGWGSKVDEFWDNPR